MTDDPVAQMLFKVASQDRAAFRDLYSSTSSKLFGVLLRILTNRAEAEDALQEVLHGCGCGPDGSILKKAGQ